MRRCGTRCWPVELVVVDRAGGVPLETVARFGDVVEDWPHPPRSRWSRRALGPWRWSSRKRERVGGWGASQGGFSGQNLVVAMWGVEGRGAGAREVEPGVCLACRSGTRRAAPDCWDPGASRAGGPCEHDGQRGSETEEPRSQAQARSRERGTLGLISSCRPEDRAKPVAGHIWAVMGHWSGMAGTAVCRREGSPGRRA